MIYLLFQSKRRGNEVWFYKSQGNPEADFLVNPTQPELMQVCYDLQNPKTRQREISSLSVCMKELKLDHGVILTKNEEEVINSGNMVIDVVPVWKWLLSPYCQSFKQSRCRAIRFLNHIPKKNWKPELQIPRQLPVDVISVGAGIFHRPVVEGIAGGIIR